MKRFERLGDGRIKVRRRNKKRPFLIVREIKIKYRDIDCFNCDLLGYCRKLGIGKSMCLILEGLGIIETSIGIVFKKEEG